jgi:two-component system, chemotaxis family, chemotaxis protein CheY
MKCLIVEDDRVSRQVLEKMISRHGSYDIVDNGGKAVELFQQAQGSDCPYHLVLMDIMMPEVDGLQSVLRIRQTENSLGIDPARRVKIIMTSALDDPRTIMKALYESDADSYLIKPIRLQSLEDEMRAFKLIS